MLEGACKSVQTKAHGRRSALKGCARRTGAVGSAETRPTALQLKKKKNPVCRIKRVGVYIQQEFWLTMSYMNPTWSVNEVAVTHPGDLHPLEEEHGGGDVRLHNLGASLSRKLSILWVQTKTLPYGAGSHTLQLENDPKRSKVLV